MQIFLFNISLVSLPSVQRSFSTRSSGAALLTSPVHSTYSELLGPGVRGYEQATSLLVPSRSQQSAAVAPQPSSSDSVSRPHGGGRLNNAAEFAVAKMDDLVNWGRRVGKEGGREREMMHGRVL